MGSRLDPGEQLRPEMALWRLCQLGGYLTTGPPSAGALRKLMFRHEARQPPALDACREALGLLEQAGEVAAFERFAGSGGACAARWPCRERAELERRVQVMRAQPEPAGDRPV